MKNRSQKSEKFWDRMAGGKLKTPANVKPSPLRRQIENSGYFRPQDVVLDVGCGSGAMSVAMAENVKYVQGIDISGRMLKLAEHRAESEAVENVSFHKTDLLSADFAVRSFNIITVFNVMHFIPEPSEFLLQIHKLLKPGGLFISSTPCIGKHKSLLHLLMPAASKIGLIPALKLHTVKELENLMQASGFSLKESLSISAIPEQFIVAEKI